MNDTFINELKRICGSVLENELLSLHTTFKVGGPCRAMALPENIDELRGVCNFAMIPMFNILYWARAVTFLRQIADMTELLLSRQASF